MFYGELEKNIPDLSSNTLPSQISDVLEQSSAQWQLVHLERVLCDWEVVGSSRVIPKTFRKGTICSFA